MIKCIYMALDPEKELYILAIFEDFSKYSPLKGIFLKIKSIKPPNFFFFFSLHNFEKSSNMLWVFFGVKCLFQYIFNLFHVLLNLDTYLFPKNLTWNSLLNCYIIFLFYFLGKPFIFLDESWDRTLLVIWSHL